MSSRTRDVVFAIQIGLCYCFVRRRVYLGKYRFGKKKFLCKYKDCFSSNNIFSLSTGDFHHSSVEKR